jgi:hypothetical protein
MDEIRIPNIQNYTQKIVDGELILTPKKVYSTEDEITEFITNSVIVTCIVKGKEIIQSGTTLSTLECLRFTLLNIWKTMPSQKILQTTTFNFKLTDDATYKWYPELNMSTQLKNTSITFKELCNMIRVNKMSIELILKTKTDKLLHFKI